MPNLAHYKLRKLLLREHMAKKPAPFIQAVYVESLSHCEEMIELIESLIFERTEK